jgi:tryptophan synthase alpha chain
MNRSISNKFAELRADGRKALIPYLTCGYPSRKRFIEYAQLLEDCGADMLEIGLPHSDPLADGPTIRQISHTVLSRGLTTDAAFSLIEKTARVTSIPLIAMCYVNTVISMGVSRFVKRCGESNITGIIIPDLAYEERDRLLGDFGSNGVSVILLAAPTTDEKRIRAISRASSGYLYLVSITGTTGSRNSLPKSTERFIRKARAICDIPVCVGFGISNEATSRQMGRLSDGVIVGSALLNRIEESRNNAEAVKRISELMSELRRGLDR